MSATRDNAHDTDKAIDELVRETKQSTMTPVLALEQQDLSLPTRPDTQGVRSAIQGSEDSAWRSAAKAAVLKSDTNDAGRSTSPLKGADALGRAAVQDDRSNATFHAVARESSMFMPSDVSELEAAFQRHRPSLRCCLSDETYQRHVGLQPASERPKRSDMTPKSLAQGRRPVEIVSTGRSNASAPFKVHKDLSKRPAVRGSTHPPSTF